MNKEEFIKSKLEAYKNNPENFILELFVHYENESVLIINKPENITILTDAVSYLNQDGKNSYNRIIYFKDITKIINKAA